jgi:hypothetical protein
MAYMRFSTFSDNIGVNVINFQLRSRESSLEYVNMLNNSASLSWKTLIYANSGVAIKNFCFVQNSKPLILTDKAAGGAVFIDCIFDLPFDDKLFSGSVSWTKCEFDVEAPSIPRYSTLRTDVCVNQFATSDDESNSDALIWWLLGLSVAGVAGYLFFFGSPKADAEERQPFRGGAKRL